MKPKFNRFLIASSVAVAALSSSAFAQTITKADNTTALGTGAAVASSNPILKAFYDRLRNEKGKPHKVAIVAVMRKMLAVLNKLLAYPQFSLA